MLFVYHWTAWSIEQLVFFFQNTFYPLHSGLGIQEFYCPLWLKSKKESGELSTSIPSVDWRLILFSSLLYYLWCENCLWIFISKTPMHCGTCCMSKLFFKFPIFEQFPSSLFLSPATVEEEQIIVNDTYVDDVYRYRFSRYTYDFRNEVNTTFLFYLSDFTHPFTFRVSSLFTFHISLWLQKERIVGFDWLTEWSLALLILCWWHVVFYYGREKKILWHRKDEKRTKYNTYV